MTGVWDVTARKPCPACDGPIPINYRFCGTCARQQMTAGVTGHPCVNCGRWPCDCALPTPQHRALTLSLPRRADGSYDPFADDLDSVLGPVCGGCGFRHHAGQCERKVTR